MEPQLDIVWQARHWVQRNQPGPHTLLSAMADAIERLRESADRRGEIAVNRRREIERLRLTDDERQSIRWIVGDDISADGVNIQATLRGLLERHDRIGHR